MMKFFCLLILILGLTWAHPFFVDRKSSAELVAAANLNEWEKIEKSNPNQVLKIQLAIKQRNLDVLDRIFWQVSKPGSPQYGQYLTIDDLTNLVAPSEETLSTIRSWLASENINTMKWTKNMDFLTIFPTVAEAERLFDVSFDNYRHIETGAISSRTLEAFTVPSQQIANSLDFVVGHSGLPHVAKTKVSSSRDSKATAAMVGPQQLRTRYNVTAVGGNAQNSQAVAEFQFQYMSPTDLNQFFQQYVTFGSYNSTVARFVGSNSPSSPGVEASLDIEYIMGVAPNVPTWFYSTPSMDFWSDLTSWVGELNDEKNAPWVHSISYGDQGESQPSADYKDRLNTEFQKIGTRGISLIFASGDSGTGCLFCYWFEPSFPATSPYVTSVGATTFISGGTSGPEEAVTAFGSGGGFSWHFDQPSYQQLMVKNYLNTNSDLPEDHFYNAKGRATPDVAALGWDFAVVVGGAVESVGGTSAAAPTFSAIVSLLNEQQLKDGKKTLGFLNQWIYETAFKVKGSFFDVVQGNNQHGCCGWTGFRCTAGWDAATGVGTPNYQVLVKNLP